MRNSSKMLLGAAAAAVVATMLPSSARATNYVWNSTAVGPQSWQSAANWGGVAFPNANTDTADFRVGLGSSLAVDVGATSVTTGALYLGGTGPAVTTNVTSTGGQLIIENGDAALNGGNALIISTGTAGSVNQVSAPISLRDTLTLDTTSTIVPTFGQIFANNSTTATGTAGTRNFVNGLTGNQTLTLTHLSSETTTVVPTGGVTIPFQFSTPNNSTTTQWGQVNVSGIVNGAQVGGFNTNTQVIFGTAGSNSANTIGTVYVTNNGGASPNTYSGGTRLFRVNLILGSNDALGTGGFQHGSGAAAGTMGFNIASDNDARTIANTFTMQRNVTFNGNNSLTWTGAVTQSNQSVMTNNIAAGKTLTLTDVNADNSTTPTARSFTFDGSGTYVISGALRNHNTSDSSVAGRYFKLGDGSLTSNGVNTYTGLTFVGGGLMQFKDSTSYGTTSGIQAITGSTVGTMDGTTAAGFLGKLTAAGAASTGGLALDANDAAVNLDFTGAGNMSHANLVGMSVGANSDGVSYTGTITPPAAGYRLGGGGTLTLPNANQLTGASPVKIVNGGTVSLQAANNYSGPTSVTGSYVVSTEQAAAANNGTAAFLQSGVYIAPTLVFGTPTALGTSADDAANLVVNGSTLKYDGSGGNSNRLFTIASLGATLDASGTGAINFTNPGAIASGDVTGSITGSTTTTGNVINAVTDISQLRVGMTVSGGDLPAGTTITGFTAALNSTTTPTNGVYTIRISSNAVTAQAAQTLTFGTTNRTLTLTGSNTGNNTIAGVLSNAGTGTLAVNKTGAGKWVLGGANTYTGGTTVTAGTLSAGHGDAFADGALNVADGAVGAIEPNTSKAVTLTTLNTNTSGKFNITNNSMVIKGMTDSAVRTQLQAGYNNGAWSGATGIVSSSITSETSVGYATQAQTAITNFKGVTGMAGTDVLVKFTYAGDANLDGKVDIGDLGLLAGAWQATSGKVWFDGDFTYDGKVDIGDLGLLSGNWQKGTAGNPNPPLMDFSTAMAQFSAFDGVVVPEPASLSVLALGGLALGARRRRRGAGSAA